MGATSIEWTDYPFNPWWGCQRVSPGCENCYAEAFAKRVGHGKRLPTIWGPSASSERKFFGSAHWNEPLKWNAKAERDGRRARVFCASMADVFEDDKANPKPGYYHPTPLRGARRTLWSVIHETPQLDWLLLTKRPQNAERLAFQAWSDAFALSTAGGEPEAHWLPNIWIGTTVEDQKRAEERIPELLKVPARVRFLSCEPLLESVDLACASRVRVDGFEQYWPWLGVAIRLHGMPEQSPTIDWVIVGGESGPGARPFDLAWARSIRDQCKAAGVACFVKQMGAEAYDHDLSHRPMPFADKKGGDWAEWPEDLRVREWPEVRA